MKGVKSLSWQGNAVNTITEQLDGHSVSYLLIVTITNYAGVYFLAKYASSDAFVVCKVTDLNGVVITTTNASVTISCPRYFSYAILKVGAW